MIKTIMERRTEDTELTTERTETLERRLVLGPTKLNRERDDPYADMI